MDIRNWSCEQRGRSIQLYSYDYVLILFKFLSPGNKHSGDRFGARGYINEVEDDRRHFYQDHQRRSSVLLTPHGENKSSLNKRTESLCSPRNLVLVRGKCSARVSNLIGFVAAKTTPIQVAPSIMQSSSIVQSAPITESVTRHLFPKLVLAPTTALS